MTRVLIASGSPLIRAGIETMLAAYSGIAVVGSVADLTQLERTLDTSPAEVVIADVDDEIPQELAAVAESTPVIVLAGHPDRGWIAGALQAGMRAVLSRDLIASELGIVIEAAAAGFILVRPDDFPAALIQPRSGTLAEPLTEREVEVLDMLAEGLSNKLIATRLGISEHTVKFHVASVMAKLNAGSRTEAVTLGLRQGLIKL